MSRRPARKASYSAWLLDVGKILIYSDIYMIIRIWEKGVTASPACGARKWIIFVDGASSTTGSGAGIILENGEGILVEVSMTLSFPTSNNQAEYEAFLTGLRLAEDLGAEEITICTDSQLVALQVRGEY